MSDRSSDQFHLSLLYQIVNPFLLVRADFGAKRMPGHNVNLLCSTVDGTEDCLSGAVPRPVNHSLFTTTSLPEPFRVTPASQFHVGMNVPAGTGSDQHS